MQPDHGRIVPLALSAALAACGGSTPDGQAPAPGQPAGAATIEIQGWPQGTTGTLRFYRNATVDNVLAEVPITAEGRATYALPVPAGLIAFAATPGLTVSPPDARFQLVIVMTTRLGASTSETGEVRLGNRLIHPAPVAGDTLVGLFYVDRDVSITGVADGCTYDQHFTTGWNFLTSRVEVLVPYTCSAAASPTTPAGIGWHYIFLGP